MGLKLCPVDKQREVVRRTPCRANTRNQGEALKRERKGRGGGGTHHETRALKVDLTQALVINNL